MEIENLKKKQVRKLRLQESWCKVFQRLTPGNPLWGQIEVSNRNAQRLSTGYSTLITQTNAALSLVARKWT